VSEQDTPLTRQQGMDAVANARAVWKTYRKNFRVDALAGRAALASLDAVESAVEALEQQGASHAWIRAVMAELRALAITALCQPPDNTPTPGWDDGEQPQSEQPSNSQ
jgi:hypothetical protein